MEEHDRPPGRARSSVRRHHRPAPEPLAGVDWARVGFWLLVVVVLAFSALGLWAASEGELPCRQPSSVARRSSFCASGHPSDDPP